MIGSNILCDKHNSTLSPIDSEFLKLHKYLDITHEHITNTKNANTIELNLNGLLLERLVLKILFGIIASGNAKRNGNPYKLPPLISLFQIDRHYS